MNLQFSCAFHFRKNEHRILDSGQSCLGVTSPHPVDVTGRREWRCLASTIRWRDRVPSSHCRLVLSRLGPCWWPAGRPRPAPESADAGPFGESAAHRRRLRLVWPAWRWTAPDSGTPAAPPLMPSACPLQPSRPAPPCALPCVLRRMMFAGKMIFEK